MSIKHFLNNRGQLKIILQQLWSEPLKPSKVTINKEDFDDLIKFAENNDMYKNLKPGPCKFCGAEGTISNQGGIDGISEWEVYAIHDLKCPCRHKGIIQEGTTWHSLDDWRNFYSTLGAR